MRHRTISSIVRGDARRVPSLTTVAAVAMLTAACDSGSHEDCDQAGTTGSAAASSDDGTPPPPPGTTGGESADGTSTGEPPPGTSTGEPPDETTGEPPGTTGDETTDGGSSTGEPVEDPPPPWVISVDSTGFDNTIVQIDIETGAHLDFCNVVNGMTGSNFTSVVYSSTFTRDDRLLVSTASQIWEIELPACEAFLVGPIGFSTVYGIAPDEANDLFALDDNTNQLLRIDAQTGVGTAVGPLGADWFTLGITWNDDTQTIVGLDGNTDALYDIDAITGIATLTQMLAYDFFQIAFEWHGATGQYYACSDDAHFMRIENDGSLTDLGALGFSQGCFNLAAPWSDMAGLPPLP